MQLRQHSFAQHRGKPLRWIDTTTGRVCGEEFSSSTTLTKSSQSSTSSSGSSSDSAAAGAVESSRTPQPQARDQTSRKQTARKSTSRSGAIRMAVFRCGEFFSIRKCSAADSTSGSGGGLEAESSPATSSAASVDSGISQSQEEDWCAERTARSPPSIRCVCHLCDLACGSRSAFADHLRNSHYGRGAPRIEILADDDPPARPRRCGFCPYRTLSDRDFRDHLSAIHHSGVQPLVCCVCRRFASLEVCEVRKHCAQAHPHVPADFEVLSTPFSMLAVASRGDYVARDDVCTLEPDVCVTDVADMSHSEFGRLLDRFAVWFDF